MDDAWERGATSLSPPRSPSGHFLTPGSRTSSSAYLPMDDRRDDIQRVRGVLSLSPPRPPPPQTSQGRSRPYVQRENPSLQLCRRKDVVFKENAVGRMHLTTPPRRDSSYYAR